MRLSAALSIVVLAAPAVVLAVPVAEEPFVIGGGGYTAGANISGQNPTVTGFTGAWTDNGTGIYRTESAGLDYFTGLHKLAATGGSTQIAMPSSGNRQVTRQLSYDVGGLGNSTVYFSGLMSFPEPGTINSGGFAMMKVMDTDSDLPAETFGLQVGVNQGELRLRARSTGSVPNTDYTVLPSYVPGQRYFTVIKAEINDGAAHGDPVWTDYLSVWVNPPALTSEAAAGTPQLAQQPTACLDQATGSRALDRYRLRTVNFASGTAAFDEFRMGATWADVTPLQSVQPATFATEPFTYPTPTNVNTGTLNGGTGWSGAWDDNGTGTVAVRDPGTPLRYQAGAVIAQGGAAALRATGFGGADRHVDRALAQSYTGDVWMSTLMRWDPSGQVGQNDFLGVGLTDGTANIAALGIKGNQDTATEIEDFFVRTGGGNEAYVPGLNITEGDTYFLVGRLHKDGGSATYNVFDLWVNPTMDAVNSPDATSFGNSGLASISAVDVKHAFLESGEWVFMDQLRLGATWFDVVLTPEPSSLALLALGGAALWRRRRTRPGR